MTRILDTTPAEKKRPVWKPLAAAGIGGAVLVATGFGVFAQLQAEATGTQAVNSGTLLLRLANNGVGFSTTIEKLAPLDTVNRHVTLTNTGTLAGRNLRVQIAAAQPNLLVDKARGLTASISTCPVAWTATAGTCQGGAGSEVIKAPVADIITAAQSISTADIAAETGQVHLQIKLTLQDNTELSSNGVLPTPAGGTIQGLTNALTFTFTEDQRAATTTTS